MSEGLFFGDAPLGRCFVATCYEILLGRELDAREVAEERGRWPQSEVIGSFLSCDEFERCVIRPVREGLPFEVHRYVEALSMRHRYWIADFLPITGLTEQVVYRSTGWRGLLAALLSDERLMLLANMSPILDLPSHADWETDAFFAQGGEQSRDITILGSH